MDHRRLELKKLAYLIKYRECPVYRKQARDILRHLRYGRNATDKISAARAMKRMSFLSEIMNTLDRNLNG